MWKIISSSFIHNAKFCARIWNFVHRTGVESETGLPFSFPKTHSNLSHKFINKTKLGLMSAQEIHLRTLVLYFYLGSQLLDQLIPNIFSAINTWKMMFLFALNSQRYHCKKFWKFSFSLLKEKKNESVCTFHLSSLQSTLHLFCLEFWEADPLGLPPWDANCRVGRGNRAEGRNDDTKGEMIFGLSSSTPPMALYLDVYSFHLEHLLLF